MKCFYVECSYYGELRLNKVSEVEDHFFHAGADSWYLISLEILTDISLPSAEKRHFMNCCHKVTD